MIKNTQHVLQGKQPEYTNAIESQPCRILHLNNLKN